MTRVLFVGQRPETVDFTNPAIPPGMNAEKIHAGIEIALKQMAERGWIADLCLLQPDETAGPDVERYPSGVGRLVCGVERVSRPRDPVEWVATMPPR